MLGGEPGNRIRHPGLGLYLVPPCCCQSASKGFLAFGLRRGALAPGFSGRLADIRQQLSGLSLALMALLLALAANIGVGTMVEGFRETFLTWLDQRLAAEVYVRGADDAESQAIRTLGRRESHEVDAVLPSKGS